MEEPDLPPIPATAKLIPSRQSSCLHIKKRARSNSSYNHLDDSSVAGANTSSDPALFSSDEQDPGAENYASTRRKKKHFRGTWWDSSASTLRSDKVRNSAGGKKREFKRNFDSGIFMASSSSGSDFDNLASDGSQMPSSDSFGDLEEELLREQQEQERDGLRSFLVSSPPAFEPKSPKVVDNSFVAILSPRMKRIEEPPEMIYARTVIQSCLDSCTEDVDLSSCGLKEAPAELASLRFLTKATELVPGMLDTGKAFEAHPRLYLANNLFTAVPRPVLQLTNLRFLSLRQNKLLRIPSTIRQLTKLQELNISGNDLSYLPFELLDLVRNHELTRIVVHANPWEQPEVPLDQPLYYKCDNLRNTLLRKTHANKAWPQSSYRDVTTTTKTSTSTISSLSEQVLRQLARLDSASAASGHKTDYLSLLPEETTPPGVFDKIEALQSSVEAGGHYCTGCGRSIVLASKTWLEWWDLVDDEPLPFLITLCHENCRDRLWMDHELPVKKILDQDSVQTRLALAPENDDDGLRYIM